MKRVSTLGSTAMKLFAVNTNKIRLIKTPWLTAQGFVLL